MVLDLRNRRYVRTLATLAISLLFVVMLMWSVDWRESIRIFRNGVSLTPLLWFCIMSFVIVGGYAFRWRLLLADRIQRPTAWFASMLGLGANMVLPARGGDFLRVHYSHIASGIPYADGLGALFAEKIVDLTTIIIVGFIAVYFLTGDMRSGYEYILLASMLGTLALVFTAVVILKFFTDGLTSFLRLLFKLLRMQGFFDRHLTSVINSSARSLSISRVLLPTTITLALWFSAYALAYLFVARAVGLSLGYKDSLFILFAGALGLMIPAAPSGIGTFHASVVSAFIMLGRSSSEGLLLATAVHLLFFIIYVVPAAFILGHWHLNRLALRKS